MVIKVMSQVLMSADTIYIITNVYTRVVCVTKSNPKCATYREFNQRVGQAFVWSINSCFESGYFVLWLECLRNARDIKIELITAEKSEQKTFSESTLLKYSKITWEPLQLERKHIFYRLKSMHDKFVPSV